MAYYDPLTDLPNRRLLESLLKREIASVQRYDYETVIIKHSIWQNKEAKTELKSM